MTMTSSRLLTPSKGSDPRPLVNEDSDLRPREDGIGISSWRSLSSGLLGPCLTTITSKNIERKGQKGPHGLSRVTFPLLSHVRFPCYGGLWAWHSPRIPRMRVPEHEVIISNQWVHYYCYIRMIDRLWYEDNVSISIHGTLEPRETCVDGTELDIRLAVIPWQVGVVSKLMLMGGGVCASLYSDKGLRFSRGSVPWYF